MSTTRPMRQLARKRLDERFSAWKSLPPATRIAPRGGWVRAIREALGMPRQELGRRMGVGEKRVMQLENGEAQGKITVESLARAAEALDCELVVALLPRRPLEQTVTDRRMQLAASWLKTRALDTMAMENQAVSLDDLPSRIVREIEQQFPDERLWDPT